MRGVREGHGPRRGGRGGIRGTCGERPARRARTAAAVALLLAACGGDAPPTGPAPGPPPATGPAQLSVVLTTQSPNDRGLRVRLRGPAPIDDVRGAQPGLLVRAAPAAQSVDVVVLGPLASGPVLTFPVPDVSLAASYTVQLLDVASAAGRLQERDAYEVEVRRPVAP